MVRQSSEFVFFLSDTRSAESVLRSLAMGIIGDRPESGVRVTLTKDVGDAYRGEATTPTQRHPVRITIGEGDSVDVAIDGPGAADGALTERVRLIVRTAIRHARADGRPLPRSIQRWRP